MKVVYLWFFLAIPFMLICSVNALEINEIMYNPEGDDNNHEFVELFSAEPMNLTNYIIGDQFSNDTLVQMQFFPGNYSLIVEEGFDYTGINASIYSAGKTIGNNLNDEDAVYLFDPNGTLLDFVAYNSSLGGKNNNKSLERTENDEWRESLIPGGTPGKENSIYAYSETDSENNSVENQTEEAIEVNPECDWELSFDLNDSIFLRDNLDFKIVVKRNEGLKQNVSVKGNIKNFFGEIVKEYAPWSNAPIVNHNSKSYSPNLPEGIYLISFWIEELPCNDTNSGNNQVSKLLAVNSWYGRFENSLEIEKIYLGSDNKAEWADQFTAKINVYKGNDTKTAVELWAEKDGEVVSLRSKANLNTKFRDYSLTLPVQLHPNCANEDSSDGKAKLIVEGLGLRAEQEFLIEGIDEDVCKDYSKYIKDKEKEELKEQKKEDAFKIIGLPSEIEPGAVLKVKFQVWDDKDHKFKAWSYLFRGNKCYSCSSDGKDDKMKDDNIVQFNYNKGEAKEVELLVPIDDDLEDGEYNLMVKLNKDSQKTDKSFSQKIYVKKKVNTCSFNESLMVLSGSSVREHSISAEKELKQENNDLLARSELLAGDELQDKNELKGIVVYESTSEKSKELIPLVLLAAFALLSLLLAWRKA